MTTLRTAAQQALEKVQEFKRRWLLVPAFGNKVNKTTREAITNAHSPIFELEHALHAALEQQAEPVACFIGVKGSAFDLPTTKRAYSYAEQPGDAVAYRLGVACIAAALQSAVDSIDRGLRLLKELQTQGFGVFDIGAEYVAQPQQAEPVQDWDELEALRGSLREHMSEIHRLRAELANHSGNATEIDQEIEAAMADQVTYGLGIMLDGKRINPASIYKQAESANCQESRQAEPVQEPVAWMFEFPDKRIAPKFDSCPHGGNWMPLYTAPPKRKPLTDEEIHDRFQQSGKTKAETRRLITRAIERAHGIGASNE